MRNTTSDAPRLQSTLENHDESERDPKCVGCGARLLALEEDEGNECAACSPKARARVAKRAAKATKAPRVVATRYVRETGATIPILESRPAIALTD